SPDHHNSGDFIHPAVACRITAVHVACLSMPLVDGETLRPNNFKANPCRKSASAAAGSLPIQLDPASTGCAAQYRADNLHLGQGITERCGHRLLFKNTLSKGVSHVAVVIAGFHNQFFADIVTLDQEAGRCIRYGAEWNRKK